MAVGLIEPVLIVSMLAPAMRSGCISGGLAHPANSAATTPIDTLYAPQQPPGRTASFGAQAARIMVNNVFKSPYFILNKQLLGGVLTLQANRKLVERLEKVGLVASGKFAVVTLAFAGFAQVLVEFAHGQRHAD